MIGPNFENDCESWLGKLIPKGKQKHKLDSKDNE